ncbi:phosphate acetyltransferase [Tranquillimonas alkanivorans]|uniref:Acyl dehydratase n=1 Tax=Tranquillimonas alkanivorans TaxID=441119 RepID=A0A1I5URH2_9RHOB|nr:phosphate acetyltransferase [Tranquillimonas alkanivorans]SFP97792.1 Acyl dehydratase [Tranquillimonas alkanivorans]
MELGDKRHVSRTFGAAEVEDFARLTGSPVDGAVPEPLVAAMFSYLLGVKLPGPGTNYLKQEMRFLAPAPVGQPLMASVEVTRVRPEKHLVDLWASCATEDGTVVCEGRSLVLVKDVGA